MPKQVSFISRGSLLSSPPLASRPYRALLLNSLKITKETSLVLTAPTVGAKK